MAAADIASAGVGSSDMRMRSSNRTKETLALSHERYRVPTG